MKHHMKCNVSWLIDLTFWTIIDGQWEKKEEKNLWALTCTKNLKANMHANSKHCLICITGQDRIWHTWFVERLMLKRCLRKNTAAQPRLTISRQPVRERCCTHAENIPKMRHIHPPPVPLPTDCMPLEVGSDVSSWAGPAANPVGPWWMWWVEWSGPRHEACCAQRSQSRLNSPNDP